MTIVSAIFKVGRRIKLERSDIHVSDDGIELYLLFAAGFVRDMESAWDGPRF